MKKWTVFKKISPLGKTIVLYVVLASTVITLFTSAFQLYLIYKTEVSAIEVRLNEIRDSYGQNIASRLWVSNQKELVITLQGILSLSDIEYIEIFEDKALVMQQGKIPDGDTMETAFPLFYNYRNTLKQIGRIRIVASLTHTYRQIYKQAIAIILSNGIKTFFISGFMLFIFYTLVAKHLIKISRFAETLDINNFDSKLVLHRKYKGKQLDEIDYLADALIRLQKRLKDSSEELHNNQITLKNSETKFKSILESAVNGILLLNSNGVISLVNKAICDLTGYSREELVGETLEKIVPGSFVKNLQFRENISRNPVACYMGEGNILRARHKDGSYIDVEVSFSTVEMESEYIVEAIIQDVSARIKIEKERESLLRSLEYKNEELERFTYTVSHDLKSPLVTINGFIGFLKKDIAANNQKKIEADFKRIYDAANVMQDLLDDLLALSRIGHDAIERVDVSVNDIIDSVLEMLAVKIKASKAKITVEPNLPIIHVEEVRFREVYLNLIENAIKYRNKNSKIEITIGVNQENGSSAQVFFVKDNGKGIDSRYHTKIFGLFERLSNDTEGTGVGLAIVKRIIETHNGRIWVESDGIGNGTIISFVIADKN